MLKRNIFCKVVIKWSILDISLDKRIILDMQRSYIDNLYADYFRYNSSTAVRRNMYTV